MFLSGARAEAAAHALARCRSALGGDVEVVVHDRAGTAIGQIRYVSAWRA